jgi:hypothetical protein
MRAAAQTRWAAGGAEPGRANHQPYNFLGRQADGAPARRRAEMRPLRRCTPGGARESGRSAASRQSAARAPRARAAAPPAPPRRRAVSAHGMLWSGLCSRGRPRRAGRARAHRCMAHVAARMLFCIAGLPGGARRGRCPALALAGAGSRPLPPTCSLLLAQRLYSKESRFGIHQQRRPVRVLGRQACARQPHRRCRAGPHPDVALDAGVAHDRIGGGVDVQLREARQRGRRRDHGLDRAPALPAAGHPHLRAQAVARRAGPAFAGAPWSWVWAGTLVVCWNGGEIHSRAAQACHSGNPSLLPSAPSRNVTSVAFVDAHSLHTCVCAFACACFP